MANPSVSAAIPNAPHGHGRARSANQKPREHAEKRTQAVARNSSAIAMVSPKATTQSITVRRLHSLPQPSELTARTPPATLSRLLPTSDCPSCPPRGLECMFCNSFRPALPKPPRAVPAPDNF